MPLKHIASAAALIAATGAASAQDVLLPADSGEGWGYVDADGEWAIEPRFEQAERFSEGLALAFDGENWGYIDDSGEWAIEPRFRNYRTRALANRAFEFADPPATAFRNGYAAVCEPASGSLTECVLIDREGETVDGVSAQTLRPPSEDLIAFQEEGMRGEWGFMTIDGEVVVEPRFREVGDVSEGMAWAETGFREVGFIDPQGDWVLEAGTYEEAGDVSEGLAPVELSETSDWAYIDADGEVVIEGPFMEASAFSESVARVQHDFREHGYVDRDGDPALQSIAEREDVCIFGDLENGVVDVYLANAEGECGGTARGYGRIFAEQGRPAYLTAEGETVWSQGD